jgi:hypothetical protein
MCKFLERAASMAGFRSVWYATCYDLMKLDRYPVTTLVMEDGEACRIGIDALRLVMDILLSSLFSATRATSGTYRRGTQAEGI